MNVNAFSQYQGSTIAAVPGATSASFTFSAQGAVANVIRIANKSSVDIAFRTGIASAGTVTALLPVPGTPGDCIVLAGAIETFTKGNNSDTIAIIGTGAGTGNVYVTPGEGQ